MWNNQQRETNLTQAKNLQTTQATELHGERMKTMTNNSSEEVHETHLKNLGGQTKDRLSLLAP